MPSENNEAESVSSKTKIKTKTSHESLSLIDSDKLGKKTKSTDDVSLLSESVESKSSSAAHRRSGRKKIVESSSHISASSGSKSFDPYRNDYDESSSKELNDVVEESRRIRRGSNESASKMNDVAEENRRSRRGSNESSSKTKQRRSRSRESLSSRETKSSASPSSRCRGRSSESSEDRSTMTDDDSKQQRRASRRDGSKKLLSQDEKVRSGRRDNNKLRPTRQKDDSSNVSYNEAFDGMSIDTNFAPTDDSGFNDTFTSFAPHNDNNNDPFQVDGNSTIDFSTAFSQSQSTFPTTGSEFTSTQPFDSGFPTDPSFINFDANNFATATNDSFTDFNAFEMSDNRDKFPKISKTDKQKEIIWDHSPHKEVPPVKRGEFQISQNKILSKDFACSPISNPLNGNVIFCCQHNNNFFIKEIDTKRNNIQVASISILTDDVRNLILKKHKSTIFSIKTIITLKAGLHVVRGRTRVRIASIIDFNILESNSTLRIALIWRWGYLNPLISLQFALSMPTSLTGSDYDCQSLMIADDLIFLPGMSSNGALLFISKPIQSEAWSINYLSNNSKIRKAEISQRSKRREFPYVALAFADGSLSVWTYKAALGSAALKDSGVKKIILPLCILDHKSIAARIESTIFAKNERMDNSGVGTFADCSDLVWIPQSHPFSQMMLLAVALQNGLAVFNIAFQVGETVRPWKEPTPATALSETPSLSPFAAMRWNKIYSTTSLCWYSITSQIGPCFTVSLGDKNSNDVLLLNISMELDNYQRESKATESVVSLRVISKETMVNIGKQNECGLLHSGQSNTSIFFSQSNLFTLNLTSSQFGEGNDLNRITPITSSVPGVSSSGEATGEDENGEIMYIVKSIHCECRGQDSIIWGSPVLRYWIARAYSDGNKTTTQTKKKQDSEFEESSQSFAEAATELVCELHHKDLIAMDPVRVVKNPGSSLCAVVYRPTLDKELKSTSKPAVHQCRKTAFIDISKKDAVSEVLDGRDIVFFDNLGVRSRCGLLLGHNGSSLSVFQWDGENPVKVTNVYRPILGVECNQDFLACKRLFLFGDATSCNLFVVGKRIHENRLCLLIGESSDTKRIAADFNIQILPNFVKGPWCWLDENEELLSAVSLESYGSGIRNVAVATSKRILILSPSLLILSEQYSKLSSSQIAPIGAFGVCFEADNKVQYLCCLDGLFRYGVIASFSESDQRPAESFLCAIGPDRLLLLGRQISIGRLEYSMNPDSFLLPALLIKPALMLEVLIANAVSFKDNMHTMIPLVRTVIERFGRKVSLIAHSENEGLGQKGAGLTERTLHILRFYGLHDAYSWLLTGVAQFDISANSVVLPPWIPIAGKSTATFDSSEVSHVLANGDSDVLEYLKSSDTTRPVTLPRISDPMSYLSDEYAKRALSHGATYDALKMLDLGAKDCSDIRIIQLSMMLQRNNSKQSFNNLFKSISGFDGSAAPQSSLHLKAPKSLSALMVSQSLKNKAQSKRSNVVKWMEPLAPSIQRGPSGKRARQQLLEHDLVIEIGAKVKTQSSKIWSTPCNESRHFWNEGPQKDRRKLLLLDRLEDWLERRRPLTIGDEGALATQDRGEKTLADILNKMDDSFGERSDIDSVKDIWVEGVGDGRSDESNLSGYFRFSEGENEECQWKKDGFVDLSPYQNKAVVVGDPELVSLEQSTSSVDEGEQGKVKSLYDLVFLSSGCGGVSGLAVSASRGGSLDIGLLHSTTREARAKCTIEFWFYLPKQESLTNNLILARRTMGISANDFSKACLASQSDCALWELRLLKSGEIDFRSCDGSRLLVSKSDVSTEQLSKDTDNDVTQKIVAFEKWNHVALVLSSKGLSKTQCEVKVYLKGVESTSSVVTFLPPGLDESAIQNDSSVDDLLQNSHIVFGLDHPPNFRLTELRVWACSRTPEDVQSFLYEYLTAAEQKKKFKVKITNKGKKASSLQKFGFAAPKGALNDANRDGVLPQRGMIAMKSGGLVSFVNKSVSPEKTTMALTSSKNDRIAEQKEMPSDNLSTPTTKTTTIEDAHSNGADNMEESYVGQDEMAQNQSTAVPSHFVSRPSVEMAEEDEVEEDQSEVTREDTENAPMTLWDTALALSQQIRPSAAAALIRGPPATRHYGGNRGGLPDFSGADRFGVGGVAICGSEKTIVFRDNEDPPALTYPIGASGAVVSDQMDDEGSEFLCCFLANEKRMVVFELRSRTVVVELQMTTKLNFWRYLPPEAAENTLCFMLITPVGGFHWMPLEESPRPHQIWKRGTELQGKKIVGYEEGGTNGLDDHEIRSNVGLVLATKASGGGFLEAWIVPVAGDSRARLVSDNIMGACLCQPLIVDDGSFLPLIVAVYTMERTVVVNLVDIVSPNVGSIELGDVEASHEIDISEYERNFEPPPLAMGTYPEALCVSLSNIIVVMLRSKGVIAAFELEEDQLNLIAQEYIDHYIIDAVMRYSAEVGGAEIVMLLADNENPKDGRIVSFCFRSAV